MDEALVRRLVALNEAFYARFAAPFAASRAAAQPGFTHLLPYLPAGRPRLLDVGCGDGRFGRFLAKQGVAVEYVGIDFSADLLVAATGPGRFVRRDLSRAGSLDDLGRFALIVCLATLQHIPGWANRARMLAEMGACLEPGGHIALANWQFTASERQRRKIRPWAEAQIDAATLEAGDYLLSWHRGGYGLRYVALLDEAETQRLADAAGLRVVAQFYSDGREGNLNLYTLLA
jgi:2-polyprenyl-3-methyl-5-hydroxy-6-metoxy-1,4-benzoquinol methylase